MNRNILLIWLSILGFVCFGVFVYSPTAKLVPSNEARQIADSLNTDDWKINTGRWGGIINHKTNLCVDETGRVYFFDKEYTLLTMNKVDRQHIEAACLKARVKLAAKKL